MELHSGAAVFQLIGFFDRGERQLAFLADGYETDIQFVGHHGPEDETARVKSGHYVRSHGGVHVAVHKGVNQHPENLGILQKRRDVTELHAWRRPVGDSADMVTEVLIDAEVLHRNSKKRRQSGAALLCAEASIRLSTFEQFLLSTCQLDGLAAQDQGITRHKASLRIG